MATVWYAERMNQVDQLEHVRRQIAARTLIADDHEDETLRLERAVKKALRQRADDHL